VMPKMAAPAVKAGAEVQQDRELHEHLSTINRTLRKLAAWILLLTRWAV